MVRGDPIQPRAERAVAPERVDRLEDADEDLLGDVLRLGTEVRFRVRVRVEEREGLPDLRDALEDLQGLMPIDRLPYGKPQDLLEHLPHRGTEQIVVIHQKDRPAR